MPCPARQLGTALVCVQEVDPSEFGVGALAANFDEEVPTMEGEGTRRLALLDMDWEHVRAVDILMVLRSFLVEVGCPIPQHNAQQPKISHWKAPALLPGRGGLPNSPKLVTLAH